MKSSPHAAAVARPSAAVYMSEVSFLDKEKRFTSPFRAATPGRPGVGGVQTSLLSDGFLFGDLFGSLADVESRVMWNLRQIWRSWPVRHVLRAACRKFIGLLCFSNDSELQ